MESADTDGATRYKGLIEAWSDREYAYGMRMGFDGGKEKGGLRVSGANR